jgi:hypothetical protein
MRCNAPLAALEQEGKVRASAMVALGAGWQPQRPDSRRRSYSSSRARWANSRACASHFVADENSGASPSHPSASAGDSSCVSGMTTHWASVLS